MANLADTVIVRSKVTELRTKIAELSTMLREHIGSRGDAHDAATSTTSGFMTAALYNKLLGLQAQIDALRASIANADLPDGVMLYYCKAPSTIPDGFVLCDGNNGTLNFTNKMALGLSDDASLGVTGGTTVLPSKPLPRHRHSYKNYVCCEVWSELTSTINSNSNVIGEYSDNKYGSGVGGSASSMYPLYYTDYTGYAGNSTSSSSSVSIMPPYRGLHVIKRSKKAASVASDSVGSLHILVNSNTIPTGMFLCNGQWVSATIYKDLYRYALSSGLIVTETMYTSQLNTYGAAPVFAYNSTNNLLRLPTINNVLAARSASGVENSAKVEEGSHFHALGKMYDNNGYWGRYSYSNAPYPAGTKGYYWNGSGGHSTTANPDYTGDIIVSNNINLGTTGNGEICNSTNVKICIRAYHANVTTVYSDDILADTEVLYELLKEALPVSYLSGTPGFRKENGGITEVWGNILVGTDKGTDIISVTLPIPLESQVCTVHLDIVSATTVVSPVLVAANTTSLQFRVLGERTDSVEVQYRILGK